MWRWSAVGLMQMAMAATLCAQQSSTPTQPAALPAPSPTANALIAPGSGAEQGTLIDSVVAVVNGDVILESDVDEERRFEAIQPYRGSVSEFSRDRAVQRP